VTGREAGELKKQTFGKESRLFLPQTIHTVSGALPVFCCIGTGGALFCEVKLLGHGAVQPLPFMPSSRMSTFSQQHSTVNTLLIKNAMYSTHTHIYKTTQDYYS